MPAGIISNCVLNLSSRKDRVLAEAFRVLRPGGVHLGDAEVQEDRLLHPDVHRPTVGGGFGDGELTIDDFYMPDLDSPS